MIYQHFKTSHITTIIIFRYGNLNLSVKVWALLINQQLWEKEGIHTFHSFVRICSSFRAQVTLFNKYFLVLLIYQVLFKDLVQTKMLQMLK